MTEGEADLRRQLEDLARADRWRMEMLRVCRDLELPDWCLAAGFVRNLVWDSAHGFATMTPLADIDLVFFDPRDLSREREGALEVHLREAAPATPWPATPWEVRNQARMHLKHGDDPYRDCQDALAHWLETPTAVGLRLEPDDSMTVLAPFGLADLLALRCRPTPAGRRRLDSYRRRLAQKNWQRVWPLVRLEFPE